MWCVLFLGLAAVAFGEETPLVPASPVNPEHGKRDSDRGNVVVYGSSPGNYLIQNPEASVPAQYQSQLQLQLQPQNPVRYQLQPTSQLQPQPQPQSQPQLQTQPQPKIYVNNYRKPQASTLPYSHQPSRRPQYVTVQQLAALQQAALQQNTRHPYGQGQAHLQAQVPAKEPAYDSLLGGRQAGHGSFYRPAADQRLPQQAQPQQDAPQFQYASSAAVDPTVGSFEEELAQLVAANRAQEQKYNAALHAPVARKPAPQQYLKEVTRPAVRPAPRPAQPQLQPQYEPAPVAPQPARQAPALYRYVYQHEPQQSQQLQQAKQEEQQYARQQQRVQHQPDDSLIRQLLADPPKSLAPVLSQPEAPSRSQIYVSQQTQYKKPPQYSPPAEHQHQQQHQQQQQQPAPVVRIPSHRDKPLTQEEFQSLLQLGEYTATLLPSSQSLPHQEYLLQPRYLQPSAPRAEYLTDDADMQDTPSYQPPAKRRPQAHYSPAAAAA